MALAASACSQQGEEVSEEAVEEAAEQLSKKTSGQSQQQANPANEAASDSNPTGASSTNPDSSQSNADSENAEEQSSPPSALPPSITLVSLAASRTPALIGDTIELSIDAADPAQDGSVSIYRASVEIGCSLENIHHWQLIKSGLSPDTTTYNYAVAESGSLFFCVRISSSSGSALHTISTSILALPQPTLWLKSDAGVISNAGAISQWQDQSGNDYHAGQSESIRQPQVIESAHKGLPAIRFDGIDDFLDGSHSYGARTVLVAARISQSAQDTADLAQIWGDYPSGIHVAADARSLYTFSFDGSGGAGAQYALDQNSKSSSIIQNGVDSPWAFDTFHTITASFTTDYAITEHVLGHLGSGFSVGAHHFAGDMGEIMVFDSELSSSDETLVKNYLLGRWNDSIDTTRPPDASNLAPESKVEGVRLTWDGAGGSTTGYRISYKQGDSAPSDCTSGTVVASSSILGTSHTVSGLTAGVTYAFRVCSENHFAASNEKFADGITVTGVPTAPVSLPPATGSLTTWLHADNGVSTSGSSVISWQDRSGHGHNAAQSTAGYEPQLVNNALNGKPVIRFDGVDDHFIGASAGTMKAAYIVFMVSSSTQPSNELASLFGEYDSGHIAPDPRSANARGFSFDGSAGETATYALDQGSYAASAANSNEFQWTYDQYQLVGVVFDNDIALTDFKIGMLGGGFAVGAHQFGGDIAEILVYDRALTAAEESELEAYITSQWQVP